MPPIYRVYTYQACLPTYKQGIQGGREASQDLREVYREAERPLRTLKRREWRQRGLSGP